MGSAQDARRLVEAAREVERLVAPAARRATLAYGERAALVALARLAAHAAIHAALTEEAFAHAAAEAYRDAAERHERCR